MDATDAKLQRKLRDQAMRKERKVKQERQDLSYTSLLQDLTQAPKVVRRPEQHGGGR